MNIFILDDDPYISASMHVDKHIVKMILEHAQMMCTAHHLHPNGNYDIPYKPTHINHPCNRWLRDSKANYIYLYDMTRYLNNEYKFRYNKDPKQDHKSWLAIKDLPTPDLPDLPRTPFARAMPDECKIGNDAVASYRNYYKTNKQSLFKWSNRNKPSWI